MTDLTDFLPLARESPATILARLLADVNAGIAPTDAAYLDTVPISIWRDLNNAMGLELDRLYDRACSEVPAAALPTTATGQWLDAWAATVGLERLDATAAFGIVEFTAPDGTVIAEGTQVSTEQTSADADPVTFATTEGGIVDVSGVLALPVAAIVQGAAGNVAANTVTVLGSSLDEAASLTNPAAITGGSDIETDESLAAGVARRLSGAENGFNAAWYEGQGLRWPGVGFCTVFANTPSPGHVTMVITDVANDPFAGGSPVVSGLQAFMDPSGSAGQGAGAATPGATVHVSTPAATSITVVAAITPAAGYTIDGAGGTRALRAAITDAVSRYVDQLPVGGDVVYNSVVEAIMGVDGVVDVDTIAPGAMTVNAGAVNVAIDTSHVASLVKPLTLT